MLTYAKISSKLYIFSKLSYLFVYIFFQAHRDITTIAQNILLDLVVMFFIHSPCIIAEKDPYITKNFLKLADVWHIVTFVLESCYLESWTFFVAFLSKWNHCSAVLHKVSSFSELFLKLSCSQSQMHQPSQAFLLFWVGPRSLYWSSFSIDTFFF